MKRMLNTLLLTGSCLFATGIEAKLNVFACEPEWGALAKELAGDKAEIDVATTALQNIHQIEPKPSLIAKLRRADLLLCTGAELESGWLPQLTRQSGNANVVSGNGNFMAASFITTLDKPAQIDRAAGDVHPQGNPHFHLDPYRMSIIAEALAARLEVLDAANAAVYRKNLADFNTRWSSAIKTWEAKAKPLAGRKIIVHHKSWAYLNKWLGLVQVATLEPMPGVPPTSSYLVSVVSAAEKEKPMAIILAGYQDPKAANWLSKRTGLPIVILPFSVGGDPMSKDLFSMYDSTINKLLAAAK
ncbi:MAG: metal ABC transporter substrate-binding protein [Arenimonas sp.]|uniref:metal ABC transporter substrate-binding protein n=1 Tax=Arenimonas sp. TaxID=1872635 RepID=UPI003C0EFAA2